MYGHDRFLLSLIHSIHSGKTQRSLPKGNIFPPSFDVTMNPKHWANEGTVLKLIDSILIPYIAAERERLGDPNQRALLIFDVFRAHLTDSVVQKLLEHNIHYVLVPPNLTNLYQPLDVSVNRAAKSTIHKLYSAYYREEVTKQLEAGKQPHDVQVDLRISTLKPLHAKWIVKVYDRFQTQKGKDIIVNGFRRAGILEAINYTEFPEQDPFKDL